MYKLHERCWAPTLSPDRKSGKGTYDIGVVFSDRPLEDGTTFTCKLSGLTKETERLLWSLSAFLGVTTQDPASLPKHPDWDSVLRGSSLVRGSSRSLFKAGVGEIDVRSDLRDPTEVGVRWVDGEVRVYQDGVYKGVVDTGLPGPVWAVVRSACHLTVSVICKESKTIAPVQTPVPVTYKMDSRPRGYAVIVNMTQVKDHPDRLGSEHDVTRLKTLFNKLHFKVKTFQNLSALDILEKLRGISKRPGMKSQDAFVLILMSHGGPGYILGEDGKPVNLEDTFWLFSNNGCPALRKKPKLFFIQSCNGDKEDTGVQADAGPKKRKIADLPSICDMFVAKASVKGYASFRTIDSGSDFIQSLVDEFEEHAAVLDVCGMMTRVISRVHRKATHVIQCPVFKSTLTKDLYFNP